MGNESMQGGEVAIGWSEVKVNARKMQSISSPRSDLGFVT